jgi:hypothetical protein
MLSDFFINLLQHLLTLILLLAKMFCSKGCN